MKLCRKGLHDLDDPANCLSGRATRSCRHCANERQRLSKAAGRRARGVYERGSKPTCKHGHPLVEDNVTRNRHCLACRRIQGRLRARQLYYEQIDYRRAKARRRWRQSVGRSVDPHPGCEYAEIVARDPCSYCGSTGGEADHIVPVARGGDSRWENFTGACRSCNASKNDDHLLQFLLRRAA